MEKFTVLQIKRLEVNRDFWDEQACLKQYVISFKKLSRKGLSKKNMFFACFLDFGKGARQSAKRVVEYVIKLPNKEFVIKGH